MRFCQGVLSVLARHLRLLGPFDSSLEPPHLFGMSMGLPIRLKRRASVGMAAAALLCVASIACAQSPQPMQPGQKPKTEAPKADIPKADAPKAGPSKTEGAQSNAAQARGGIDDLFRRLKDAKNPREAKSLATQIERRFARSGSDTVDLLAARANEVFIEGEPAIAIEIMDRAIVLKPDWAEGYHRRATMFFAMDDMTRALVDLNAALAREPRHFGALTGMGLVFQRLGDQKRSYEAYARAYEINPSLESVKIILERMRPDVEGRDI